jgi:quinol monooxygenase YgiN
MAATVHVIARVRAKAGKEEALKMVLEALVPPSRRELACHRYDLLQSSTDPRDFCFIERWDSQSALDQHAASEHVKRAGEQIADLVEGPPDIQRFQLV